MVSAPSSFPLHNGPISKRSIPAPQMRTWTPREVQRETSSEDRRALRAGAGTRTRSLSRTCPLPPSPPEESSPEATQGRANLPEQGPSFLKPDPGNKTELARGRCLFLPKRPRATEMDLLLNDCPLLCVIALWFYLILLSSRYCCHLSPDPDGGDGLPCSLSSRRCDREERNRQAGPNRVKERR